MKALPLVAQTVTDIQIVTPACGLPGSGGRRFVMAGNYVYYPPELSPAGIATANWIVTMRTTLFAGGIAIEKISLSGEMRMHGGYGISAWAAFIMPLLCFWGASSTMRRILHFDKEPFVFFISLIVFIMLLIGGVALCYIIISGYFIEHRQMIRFLKDHIIATNSDGKELHIPYDSASLNISYEVGWLGEVRSVEIALNKSENTFMSFCTEKPHSLELFLIDIGVLREWISNYTKRDLVFVAEVAGGNSEGSIPK